MMDCQRSNRLKYRPHKIYQVFGKYLIKGAHANRKNFFVIAACVKARIVLPLKLEIIDVIGAKINARQNDITRQCATMR